MGFMPPEMSIDQMASSAIFILSKVKKQVDTCGGFTTLVAMRPGGDFSYTSSDEISEIEEKQYAMEREANKDLNRQITSFKPVMFWHKEMHGGDTGL